MRVIYDSNNSGGDWWLKDEDWHNLEAAGWKVDWDNFLGSIANRASREGLSLPAAISEWEKVTGQWSEDEGCNCCGRPHYFYTEDGPEFDFIEAESWEIKGELNA